MLSCNKVPWISGCLFLLLMVLVGKIAPIQSHKPRDETFVIEDATIEDVLHTKVLKNTETGECGLHEQRPTTETQVIVCSAMMRHSIYL